VGVDVADVARGQLGVAQRRPQRDLGAGALRVEAAAGVGVAARAEAEDSP
jgi:hypothetical protein